jgi:hypothetical protein
MANEKKPRNSLKLAWKDAQAEATGFGVGALLIIVILVTWLLISGGALLQ